MGATALALAVCASLIVAGCARMGVSRDRDSADAITRSGMLSVADPKGCRMPRGCGPKYTLLDPALSQRVPLLGDIRDEHAQLIVTVKGRWATPADTPQGYERAIKVKKYRLRSSIKYRAFLLEQAARHTQRNYGCTLLWDTSFAWQIDEPKAYLIVRMTDMLEGRNQPYLELWYDAENGEIVREAKNPGNLDPCARA